MKTLSIFFLGNLKKYKPIQAKYVAKAMIEITEEKYDKSIFESDQLQDIGKNNEQ